ncbi:hypothetical protein R1T08_03900 [Streptomyces sp. SBC-4]|nr:hypothetical protein [Streptomyces sp. SBC-4]MDV5143455.1 hypothetical protein [Streptomyces sp. SBC-4]
MSSPTGITLLALEASWINARIRELMDEPRSDERAAEYRRLLVLWDEATSQVSGGRNPEFVTAA